MTWGYFPIEIHELNDQLEKDFGYGIWEFAHCFARIIRQEKSEYKYPPDTRLPRAVITGLYDFQKEEIRRRERLKNNIIITLHKSLKEIGISEKDEPGEKDVEYIMDVYKLRPFFETLETDISVLKQEPFWKKRGRPILARTKISSIWAQVIKDNNSADWKLIDNLLKWFFKNLEGMTYHKELFEREKNDFDNINLSHEYYAITKNKQTKKNIKILRNVYFPTPRRSPYFRIDFMKNHIDIDIIGKNYPLVKFPNEISFP